MVVKRQPSASPPKSAEIQYELVHSADQSDTKTPEEAFQQGHDNGAIPMDYGQQTYSDLPAVSQQDHIVHFDGGLDQYDSLLNDTHQYQYPDLPDSMSLGVGYSTAPVAAQRYQQYGTRDYTDDQLNQHYQQLRDQHYSGSPATPITSQPSPPARRTRSGRAIGEVDSSQILRTPPRDKPPKQSKKATKSKKDKPKAPKISGPLSKLTEEYTHIPVRDMDAWVNRSPEVRWKEAERRNKVPRPMNSFMLYRSAYADRTKIWCLQNNHQVVSSVTGESWPLEPDEIREKYINLAKIEHDNHQNAHPGYKFSPGKSSASKKRKSGTDQETEGSDLDDDESEWGETRQKKNKSRTGKASRTEARNAKRDLAQDALQNYRLQALMGQYRSSYQATNPGKPAPATMEPHQLYEQYYQPTVNQRMVAAYMENLRAQRAQLPSSTQAGYTGLIGLPGDPNQDLFSNGSTPAPLDDNIVDPLLLGQTANFSDETTPGTYHAETVSTYDAFAPGLESDHIYESIYGGLGLSLGYQDDLEGDQALQNVSNQQPGSHSDNNHGASNQNEWPAGFEPGSEFEKWCAGQT